MQQHPILTLTRTATAAVAANRYVGFDGAQLAVAGAKAFGVADYAAAAKDDFAVNVLGTTKVEAGAAIASAGVALKSDAQGRAIPQAGTGAVTGWSMQAASGAGVVIEQLLTP